MEEIQTNKPVETFFNVMVVDDEKDIADVITRALQRTSEFKVDTFYDGQAAFDNFKKHSPGYYSLVLSDIRMPKLVVLILQRRLEK